MRRFTRILFSLPHNGGAPSAPGGERRGAKGPGERPSRGVGGSPTLVWSLPTAPAEANASVDKTRRPDRRGQRADEILPVEDILHAEKDLEVASDGPLG